jgi:hypothetical protein
LLLSLALSGCCGRCLRQGIKIDSDVSSGTRATSHAAGLYRKTFSAIARPVRKVDAEVHHLEDVERAGESPETPFIAMLGVFLFLLPIFAVMLALAFAAYYLAT